MYAYMYNYNACKCYSIAIQYSVEIVHGILFGCNDRYMTTVNGSDTLGKSPLILKNPSTTALTSLPEGIVINHTASIDARRNSTGNANRKSI